MVVVSFPPDVSYVWWKPQFGETRLVDGSVLDVPMHTLIKMTAWAANGNIYVNKGSCIFIVTGSGDGKLDFGEPKYPDDNSGAPSIMTITVPGAVCLNNGFWNDIKPSLQKGYISGFNRHAIIDWEYV